MTLFHGLLAYPITPSDADGQVDTEALAVLVDRLAGQGVNGIGLLGSTGTYMFLDRDQRRRAVRTAIAAARGRVPVTVGVGALRTNDAEALARDAAEEGADGLLLAPVSYTPLTAEEVFAHVRTVAASTALPVCLYDNTATTGFRFEDALLRRLGTLPTLRAIKRPAPAPEDDASGWLERQRALFPGGFAVGCSVDWHAAHALEAGADAWHGVLAGLLPAPCLALMHAVRTVDAAEAQRVDEALSPVWALFRDHGSIRVIHAMADRLGIPGSTPPRPILPLAGAALARTHAVLERIAR